MKPTCQQFEDAVRVVQLLDSDNGILSIKLRQKALAVIEQHLAIADETRGDTFDKTPRLWSPRT